MRTLSTIWIYVAVDVTRPDRVAVVADGGTQITLTTVRRDAWQRDAAQAIKDLRTEIAVEWLSGRRPHMLPKERDLRLAVAEAGELPIWLAVKRVNGSVGLPPAWAAIERTVARCRKAVERAEQAKAACMEVWREAGYLDQILDAEGDIGQEVLVRSRESTRLWESVTAKYVYCGYAHDGQLKVFVRAPVKLHAADPLDVFPVGWDFSLSLVNNLRKRVS